MSAINQYKHEFLDLFHCPSDHELIYLNPRNQIAIYRLLENIPEDEKDFDGKAGDLLVGGGSGEAQALRISEKGIRFFRDESFPDFDSLEELVKSFWTPTFSYKMGNGLSKLGWKPEEEIEFWLAERIIEQLQKKGKI